MQIDRIEVREISIPLVRPFETSFGTCDVRQSLLIRIEADGAEGWGEVPVEEKPAFGPETTSTASRIIQQCLGPLLLKDSLPEGPKGIPPRLSIVRGHPMAKAGLEAAVWDLESARQGKSLARLYGSDRTAIAVGISLGVQDRVETLLERIGEAQDLGYRRIKIKIKRGWDLDVVREVRRVYPDIPLMVDANGAYTLDDAALFRSLDELDLMMIEQPLHPMDLVDHARLQTMMETPVCLDESLRWRGDVEAALRLGALRVVNLKPARVGGISEALAIHEICRRRGVPLWCGGLLETGVGRIHNLALASLPGFTLPGDISASERYYEKDIVDPPILLGENGRIDVPQETGLRGRVDGGEVERRTLATFELKR
ncbi:MAG: o-succinylbenzoate synthase [Planctomycetota bacterium]|nr:o-succinylbenzoate synthase [Planctomycetota bacterium]